LPPLLFQIRGISKAFPGVHALEDVSMDVRGGEVHALVGQNGAGKSTLIRTLYGAHHPDRGEFVLDGVPVRIASPADARRLGIAVIFQEFSLVPYLSVAHNVFLGREFRARVPGMVDHARMHAEARRVLDVLGLDLDTRTPAHRLGIAQQQMVEIAKALSQNARILVMDEPTASLSDPEIERLFNIIARLKREGVAVVYVSHRLHEIFEIADRITVLRDGRRVADLMPAEAGIDELVRLMVGREVSTTYRHRFCDVPGPLALDVQDLRADNGVHDVSLRVCAGEIVGLAGLVGAGRSELVRAIFGADALVGGRVLVGGAPFHGDPARAVEAGMGLVPEDRKGQGLALVRSVQDNILVASLRRMFPDRWYRPGRAARTSTELAARLRIATPSTRRLTKFLSGGNQQKVVIGKWLNAGSTFFIFDEPTRGIDVGAKAEVYGLMERLVADGAAVLMISSELPEVVSVCDRVYVMRDKTIVGELGRSDLTEENILRLAMHHSRDRGGR
jgi:ribose transport system ATP-binding protein